MPGLVQAFPRRKGQRFTISALGQGHPLARSMPVINVYDAKSKKHLVGNDDSGGSSGQQDRLYRRSVGRRLLRAHQATTSNNGGPDYIYRIEAERARPRPSALSIAPVQSPRLPVPPDDLRRARQPIRDPRQRNVHAPQLLRRSSSLDRRGTFRPAATLRDRHLIRRAQSFRPRALRGGSRTRPWQAFPSSTLIGCACTDPNTGDQSGLSHGRRISTSSWANPNNTVYYRSRKPTSSPSLSSRRSPFQDRHSTSRLVPLVRKGTFPTQDQSDVRRRKVLTRRSTFVILTRTLPDSSVSNDGADSQGQANEVIYNLSANSSTAAVGTWKTCRSWVKSDAGKPARSSPAPTSFAAHRGRAVSRDEDRDGLGRAGQRRRASCCASSSTAPPLKAKAKVKRLTGLPAKTSPRPNSTFDQGDTSELVFPLKTAPRTAPKGQHKNLSFATCPVAGQRPARSSSHNHRPRRRPPRSIPRHRRSPRPKPAAPAAKTRRWPRLHPKPLSRLEKLLSSKHRRRLNKS